MGWFWLSAPQTVSKPEASKEPGAQRELAQRARSKKNSSTMRGVM
jgi:hypothetical protein